MLGRLSWDCSDCTDAPEGHVCWDTPHDGDARIHHVEHEAPLEGLPSSLAWWSNSAQPRDTTENVSTSLPQTWHQAPDVRLNHG
jgi:hypothetical protein